MSKKNKGATLVFLWSIVGWIALPLEILLLLTPAARTVGRILGCLTVLTAGLTLIGGTIILVMIWRVVTSNDPKDREAVRYGSVICDRVFKD